MRRRAYELLRDAVEDANAGREFKCEILADAEFTAALFSVASQMTIQLVHALAFSENADPINVWLGAQTVFESSLIDEERRTNLRVVE